MYGRVALLSAVIVLGARPLGAQEVEYAAGTTRYRVSTTTKGTQSTPMGDTGFELGMRQQLTLNLARQSKDTMRATVTLDSIALDGAFYVSTKGVFLGGSSNDDVNLKLKILAQGAEISMKQNAQTKIEPIQ